jgi:hypothetical protein
MNQEFIMRRAGILLAVAVFWAVAGAVGLALYADLGAPSVAQAQGANPCNPCNPCAPKGAANPCNPCAAKGNPCNPCAAKTNPCNPCNPCSPKQANPCNPCAPKAANPCNPCAAKPGVNPCNPCNPCGGGGAAATGAKLTIGADYLSGSFEKTTGYVPSASHGDRLVVTWVYPAAAAKAYRANAAKVRAKQTSGMQAFPAGTVIVKESFVKQANGSPGSRGPIFVMKKEATGYDPSGGDWRYSMAQPDMRLIGEGFTGPVAFCKACHATMKDQDFVFAVDR